MKKLTCLALLVATTGCFHFHYVTDEKPAPAPSSEAWHHGFVWGLVEGMPVDVTKVCPSGFARIDSTETFVNGFVRFVTWSIYSPETITITCNATDAAQLPQSPDRPWNK